MDQLKNILLVLLPSLFILCSCEKDISPVAFTTNIEVREPTDVGRTFIRLHGRMSALEGINETGFVYWKSGYPGDSVKISYPDSASMEISVWLEGLNGNEPYDYYMYIGNGADRKQSGVTSFRTLEKGLPLVSEISGKVDNPAVFSARVKDDGVADGLKHLKRKGICWNTQGSPTVSDGQVAVSEGEATGFEVGIPNLQEHTVYYLRAFAENDNSDLSYGPELKIEMGKTLPQIGEVIVLDPIGKQFGSTVINEGGNALISKGFCWNREGNPTVGDQKLIADESFTARIDALEADSTYYIRAFAENAYGIVYSEQISIRIASAPKLGEIERIDPETNRFRSLVADDGGSEVLEYGFCWNQTGNPLVSENPVQGDADFTASLGDLAPGVYYMRAYAVNKVGTGYSHELVFTIKSLLPPELGGIIHVDSETNTFRSSILQDGGSEITEWGFCWNQTGNPMVSDNSVPGDADFTASLGDLAPGLYYVRAYAVNKVGISYSREQVVTSISPKTAPRLGGIDRIVSELNTFRSFIMDDGGREVTERGFCWNSTGQPTVADHTVWVDDEVFRASLGDLEPGVYYVRGYAVNEIGIGYSATIEHIVESSADSEMLK